MRWDLEELAREAHERADLCFPINPDRLALGLGLIVRDGGPGCEGYLIGERIFVDESLRPERRAFAIAHEIGHRLLQQAGLETPSSRDERGANYMGAALLLPKHEFEIDLRRRGWDLIWLHAKHRHASFEALARRIVALREARAVIFDRPLRDRRPASWYAVPYDHAPSDEERIAADEALACGAPVEIRAGLTAWPVVEHHWHRAITLAAL